MSTTSIFQLSILSQNDQPNSICAGCAAGNEITATILNYSGGTIYSKKNPPPPGSQCPITSFSTTKPVLLPIPPTSFPAPPTPTWFMEVTGGIENAVFQVQIDTPGQLPVIIEVNGANMSQWVAANHVQTTNQIYASGNCGIFGYAQENATAGQPVSWIYTITAGVCNPQIHPGLTSVAAPAPTTPTPFGGWSAWNFSPTPDAKKVFDASLGKLLGVSYKLVAFASQLVNGMNYTFLCEAETITNPGHDYIVVANVYQPINGIPHIVRIKSIGPKPHFPIGGWQNWQFAVTKRANAVFHDAMTHFVGVTYTPMAFTCQVVAGKNYCFLCEATTVMPGATHHPALVWVYQPLIGHAYVVEINTINTSGQKS